MAKKQQKIESRTLTNDEKPIFKWQSSDSISQKRNYKTYLILFLVSAGLAYIFYLLDFLSATVLVVVSALTLSILSNHKPRVVKVALFASGLLIDDKLYFYDQFKSFHLLLGEILKIRLTPIGLLSSYATFPLSPESGVDIDQIVLFLSKKLPREDDKGEDLVDQVNRFLHF